MTGQRDAGMQSVQTCSVEGCDRAVRALGMCNAHYQRERREIVRQRGSSTKVVDGGHARSRLASKKRVTGGGCWEWTGALNRSGYGFIYIEGLKRSTHRLSWEVDVGPIPDGFHIDHLCRNRACFNPAHMEPVTPRKNWERGQAPTRINANKTHCKRGHEFTPENIYWHGHKRECKQCVRARQNSRRSLGLSS